MPDPGAHPVAPGAAPSGARLPVLLLFVALSVAHLWPLPVRLGTGIFDVGDSLLNVAILGSTARQLATQPWRVFDANMYYPFQSTLATLDHQLSNAVVVAPFTLAFDNPLVGFNLFVIASFAASGYGAFLLATALTGSWPAGVVAGVLYGFSPFRFEHLSHSHVLAGFWLPFVLLAVHRFFAAPTWRALAVMVALFLAQAFASWYYATIAGLAVLVVAVFEVARRGLSRAALIRAAVGAVGIAVVLAPVARPYFTLSRTFDARVRQSWTVTPAGGAEGGGEGQGAEPPEGRESAAIVAEHATPGGVLMGLSAPLQGYLAAASGSRSPWGAGLARLGIPESRFFPGFLGLALAGLALLVAGTRAVGLPVTLVATLAAMMLVVAPAAAAGGGEPAAWTIVVVREGRVYLVAFALGLAGLLRLARRRARIAVTTRRSDRRPLEGALAYAALALVGAMFSFGPVVQAFGVSLGPGIYPATLPPFTLLRAPARFGVLWVLAASVLAAYGAAWTLDRTGRAHPSSPNRTSWLLAAGLVLVTNLELARAPIELLRVPTPPSAHRWIGAQAAGAVIEFPVHGNIWPLYWAWFHRHPVVNGYGTAEPAAYGRLKEEDDLSPAMLEHLRTYFHPKYAVVDVELYAPAARGRVLANIEANGAALQRIGVAGRYQVYEIGGGSQGARLQRVFPAWMLAGQKRLAIAGELLPGEVDQRVTIAAWLNGRVLHRWPAAELRADTPLLLDLPAINEPVASIELVTDYARSGAAGRPAIGQSGHVARSDIEVMVEPGRSAVRVNGGVWLGEKGYTLLRLSSDDGSVLDVQNFNTSWSDRESARLGAYLRELEDGTVVVVASGFDASRSLTPEAVAALGTLGLTGDLRGRFQWAHAAIGIKGAAPGSVLESVGETSASCRVGSPAPVEMRLTRFDLQ